MNMIAVADRAQACRDADIYLERSNTDFLASVSEKSRGLEVAAVRCSLTPWG
jgi:hypothetical protein